MRDEFFSIWEEFIDFRDQHIGKLRFVDQRSKFILSIYARVNALCDETLILVRHNCVVSPQILMRSTLESFIDLRCLLKDETYIACIFAAEADADYKHISKHSQSNPYYKSSDIPSEKIINNLKIERSKSLSIFQRFQKAGCEELYSTIYNNLCRYTHGNITALADKNFVNDTVVLTREFEKSEVLFILSSTINIALSCTLDVFNFFDISECEREVCVKMCNQVNVLCKKFV